MSSIEAYKVHVNKSDNTQSWYDAQDQMVYRKDSDGIERWFDSNDNTIRFKSPNGYEWNKKFNPNGIMIEYSDSKGIHFKYHDNGNPAYSKNEAGIERWFDLYGNDITKQEFDNIIQSQKVYVVMKYICGEGYSEPLDVFTSLEKLFESYPMAKNEKENFDDGIEYHELKIC